MSCRINPVFEATGLYGIIGFAPLCFSFPKIIKIFLDFLIIFIKLL